MNDKINAAKVFLKRVWDKITAFSCFAWKKICVFSKFALEKLVVFSKLVWAFIVKAYHFICPKVVSGAKFVYKKLSDLLKVIVKDKQKLILAIILFIAILFSCIAVVRAVKGVVNGVVGIFTSDEIEEEANIPDKIASPKEEAVVPSEETVSTPVEPGE